MLKKLLIWVVGLISALVVVGAWYLLIWSLYTGFSLATEALLGSVDISLSEFLLKELAAFIVVGGSASFLLFVFIALSTRYSSD